MSKKLKNTGLVLVSIAMLLLLAHSVMPHHHHDNNAFTGCCSHAEEHSLSDSCTFHAEKQNSDNHPCFQCMVEREWQLNSSGQPVIAVLPYGVHAECTIISDNTAFFYQSTIPYRTCLSGISYRGPPQMV